MGLWVFKGADIETCTRPHCGGNIYIHVTLEGEIEKKCLLCSQVNGKRARIATPTEAKEARYGWHNNTKLSGRHTAN